MIKRIRADRPSFREVTFQDGLNVVLAERTRTASSKDSRNGLGKTTLVEIIHFCLGAGSSPNEGLRVKELDNWTFTLDLVLKGTEFSISRNTTSFGTVEIQGDYASWPIQPEYSRKDRKSVLKVSDLVLVLGSLMFELPTEPTEMKYSPSFRSLVSYFIRGGIGAFQAPFKHHSQQKEWDIQVHNSFLLGLNWEYASRFQTIKDREKILNDLRTAVRQGAFHELIGTLGELDAERVRLEQEVSNAREQLKGFKVHPQYHEIENQANGLTSQIQETINRTLVTRRLIDKYNQALREENDVELERLSAIYTEARLVFSKEVKKELESVLEFHTELLSNRKGHLEAEIRRLGQEIQRSEMRIKTLSEKRGELMKILESHGALEEHSNMQQKLSRDAQYLEEIKSRMRVLQEFEEGVSKLRIEREELLQETRRDYQERKSRIETALKIFNANSESLYDEPGILSIDVSSTGYRFKVDIKRARSQGISYMKVFTYDLMLMQLARQKLLGIDFLIHDSTIFDGVDERQVSRALDLVTRVCDETKSQYICTLNSDMVPYGEFTKEFKSRFEKSIRTKLTDATPEGGLLGFRF